MTVTTKLALAVLSLESVAEQWTVVRPILKLADFEKSDAATPKTDEEDTPMFAPPPTPPLNGLGLNLAYTINLVLPKSDDVAVFNAIFRSLRENLLR